MEKITNSKNKKIKIGVSSCLLGENVRYDGGHKKNPYVMNTLKNHFELCPFCPEVAIGLGVPRETIHLVVKDEKIKCVGTKNSTFDVTDKLQTIANEQMHWQSQVSGYILKKDSPSCGMQEVKIYNVNKPETKGAGIYAQKLMDNFPDLPVEEEERLNDLPLRESFIQRVFIYARWQQLISLTFSLSDIQQFHVQHNYIYMSHNPLALVELTALINEPCSNLSLLAKTYISKVMTLLKGFATTSEHANTLFHIHNLLNKQMSQDDALALNEAITQYQKGDVSRTVPMTLLQHHLKKQPKGDLTRSGIADSFYIFPQPSELELLNKG